MAAEITIPPPPRPTLVALSPEQQRINTLTHIMNRGRNMFDQHRKCETDARATVTKHWLKEGREVSARLGNQDQTLFEREVAEEIRFLAKRRNLPKFDRAVINDGLAAEKELKNL